MTGVLDFLSPHSQVSLLSIPAGEIRLVIPLRVDTFAHCGQFGLFKAARTFQNKGTCIAEAGEGGPLDEPVCPAPRGVALSAVCLQPPSTTPKTPQEPLKMDPLLNEEDSQCAEEEEEVDPRIQVGFSFGNKKKESGSDSDLRRKLSEIQNIKNEKVTGEMRCINVNLQINFWFSFCLFLCDCSVWCVYCKQGELEKLNQSTDDINRWESELEVRHHHQQAAVLFNPKEDLWDSDRSVIPLNGVTVPP